MKQWVITIGREFCSGGADTARALAKLLDIPYYDKAIIDETVEQVGFAPEVVAQHDERPVGYTDVGGFQYGNLWYAKDPSLMLPMGMRVAEAQFQVIRKVAHRGSCVIVGRCADYALEGEGLNVLNVFIRADMEVRVRRAMDAYQLTEGDARKLIRRTDKIRASYYRYYTQRQWGEAANYHLVIDAGLLGTEGAASVIAAAVQEG